MNARAAADLAPPALFGAGVLIVWEFIVRGFGVPVIILPAPSARPMSPTNAADSAAAANKAAQICTVCP